MNSNNCREGTDQKFAAEIWQRYTFDAKKEISYCLKDNFQLGERHRNVTSINEDAHHTVTLPQTVEI